METGKVSPDSFGAIFSWVVNLICIICLLESAQLLAHGARRVREIGRRAALDEHGARAGGQRRDGRRAGRRRGDGQRRGRQERVQHGADERRQLREVDALLGRRLLSATLRSSDATLDRRLNVLRQRGKIPVGRHVNQQGHGR